MPRLRRRVGERQAVKAWLGGVSAVALAAGMLAGAPEAAIAETLAALRLLGIGNDT